MKEKDPPLPVEERMSVQLIEALSRVWSRIRVLHPGVPPVVILAAPASREARNVLGHFAALRWKGKRTGEALLHEVVVIAEFLNRPADEVAATLLHEAVHSLNFEKGIHDCAATSQYHNKHFRDAAQELGLRVERVPNYGYALTTLPPETAAIYEPEIMALELVLLHRRSATGPPKPPGTTATGDQDGQEPDEKPRSRLRKATCACGHIIRLSLKTYTDTTVRCDSCGEPFRMA